jgi:hypothetical protein
MSRYQPGTPEELLAAARAHARHEREKERPPNQRERHKILQAAKDGRIGEDGRVLDD